VGFKVAERRATVDNQTVPAGERRLYTKRGGGSYFTY
jgi:hypothetical protein